MKRARLALPRALRKTRPTVTIYPLDAFDRAGPSTTRRFPAAKTKKRKKRR